MKKLPLATAVLLAVSCGKLLNKDNNDAADKPTPTKHVVAVVDEGFDTSNSSFKDKVVASYRVGCLAGNNPLLKLAPEMRFEDLKSQFLAYLKDRSGCVAKDRLNDGISSKFADIEGVFNLWNASVKDGTIAANPNREAVQTILEGEGGKYNYHGTATAGLIAKDNDKVDLVIIEPKLADLDLPNDIFLDLGCRTQAELDVKAQVFEDKEVRDAFISASRVDVDSIIMELFKKHQVSIVNESYGPTSGPEFVDYYTKKQCPGKIDFKRLLIAEGKLMRDREAALVAEYGYNPLHVRAAGNAGKDLDLESDTLDPCKDTDDYLVVGALDRDDKVAQFSNTGRCVEVYTLGDQVIVDAPKNFQNVSNGTSYSAPLMVRYLTQNAGLELGKDELKGFALSKSDKNQSIGLADWNKNFAYKAKEAAEPQPQPQPNDNQGNGQGQQPEMKEGWTAEILKAEVDKCVVDVQNQVDDQGQPYTPEFAKAYCDCLGAGISQNFTYAEYKAAPTTVGGQELRNQCFTIARGG